MQYFRATNSINRFFGGMCLLFWCFGVSAQHSYSYFISFGDSLSDTGNLASATVNFPFPYYENRVTNGPVAIDYLAAHLNMAALASELDGNNFAVAGGNIVGDEVEDLGPQISSYLRRADNNADANALYFVMMGGNDLRGLRSETSDDAAQLLIADLVDSFILELTRLFDAGAQQFFIANVANIGRLPETLLREADDPGVAARVTAYTQAFNSLLSDELHAFRLQTASSVIVFDTYTELDSILNSPQVYGFTNSTEACFNSRDFSFHPDCIFGFKFDEFVFFDNLHPTAETHRLAGEAMVARLIEQQPSLSKAYPLAAILMLLED